MSGEAKSEPSPGLPDQDTDWRARYEAAGLSMGAFKKGWTRDKDDVAAFLSAAAMPSLHILDLEGNGCRTVHVREALDAGLIEQIPEGEVGYPNYRIKTTEPRDAIETKSDRIYIQVQLPEGTELKDGDKITFRTCWQDATPPETPKQIRSRLRLERLRRRLGIGHE
jgi:hypothetical protein